MWLECLTKADGCRILQECESECEPHCGKNSDWKSRCGCQKLMHTKIKHCFIIIFLLTKIHFDRGVNIIGDEYRGLFARWQSNFRAIWLSSVQQYQFSIHWWEWHYFIRHDMAFSQPPVSATALIANYFPWENSSNGHTTPIMKKGLTQRQCCYFSTSIWQPHLLFQSEFFPQWIVPRPRSWRKDWRKGKGFAIQAQLIHMIYPTNNSVF